MQTTRRTVWSRGAAVVAAAAVMVLASCANPEAPPEGAPAGTGGSVEGHEEVVIVTGAEPDTLNPALGYARWGDGKVVEGLLALGADLELAPLLAQDLPEVSEDGLTYTYILREGVRFHDGSELTAQDVVATYETAVDPAVGSPTAADLTALERVEAVDRRTVRFTLAHPQSSFPTATVLGVVPADTLVGQDLSRAEANRAPVGTGPYEVESWRPGEQLVLTAFDGYWGQRPVVTRATFLFAADDTARAARLSAGEVDGALLPAQALARFEDDEDFEVIRRDTADYLALVLPQDNPVTSDPVIRRALHQGIDREAIVQGALAGAGRVAYSPLPPEAADYVPVLEVQPDADAARALLQEAGWVEGPDGVRGREGQRAELVLMYPAGDTLRQNIALDVQAQAAELGIDVRPEGLSWDAIEPRMATDALVYGSGNPYSGDLSTYSLFHSSRIGQGFDNPGGYSSPQMDQALDAGRAAVQEQDRSEAYARVQEQLAEDLPWIFLVYVEHDYVIRAGQWEGYNVDLVEPHEHGLQGGPWWNLAFVDHRDRLNRPALGRARAGRGGGSAWWPPGWRCCRCCWRPSPSSCSCWPPQRRSTRSLRCWASGRSPWTAPPWRRCGSGLTTRVP